MRVFSRLSGTHVWVRSAAAAMLATMVAMGAALQPARAAGPIIVNTIDGGLVDDSGAGDCSLAEAITNANNDTNTYQDCNGGSGVDTIDFDSLLGAATIMLSAPLPNVNDPSGDGLTISGGGNISINGNSLLQILVVNSPLVLRQLNLEDGRALSGGAMYINAVEVWIYDSAFDGNFTSTSNSLTAGGGAIYNNGGTVHIVRSTFSNNSTVGQGGAIHNHSGSVGIFESTFASNTASGGGVDGNAGGAIYTGSVGASTTIGNGTFSGNSADAGKGAALHANSGELNFFNTILANSTSGDDCYAAGGVTFAAGHDLIEDSSPACGLSNGGGNIVGSDPSLGSIAGQPAYFPLMPGSVAIDAGDNTYLSGSPTDEAGNPRLVDYPVAANTGSGTPPIVDMGATEFPYTCPATRFYVDDTAAGTNDGSSWTDAFTSLQYALAGVVSCGSPHEVWVATGEYKPGTGPADTFNIPPGTAVYGGFAGTESALSQQNWEINVTVLSGDGDNNDTTDSNGIILLPGNIGGDNSDHVVSMDGTGAAPVTSTTVLDGFTITGGQAASVDPNGYVGGGLLCDGSGSGHVCSPTLSDLVFRGNYANNGGSGVENLGSDGGVSSPSLTNVKFLYNEGAAVGNYGGAGGTSSGTFTHVVFDHNTSGAMYNGGYNGTASPKLLDVTFSNNHANSNGGAIYNDGGLGQASPILTDVTFTGNTADGWGGAMYNSGDNGMSNPKLTNVVFDLNHSDLGGGAMYNMGLSGESIPTLTNVTFSGNTTGSDGGAILSYAGGGGSAWAVLKNVTFTGNHADSEGGAMYNDGSSGGTSHSELTNVTFSGNSATDGGAIFNYGDGGDSTPTLTNVTFSGNSATISGGAMYNSAQSGGISNPVLTNSILWGDLAPTGPEVQNAGGLPSIDHSVVQGGCASIPSATCGAGNLSSNPLLAALADNGGFTQTKALMPGSPAIDAADELPAPETDQRGLARPQGAQSDIGAYEMLKPVLLPLSSATVCRAPEITVSLVLSKATRTGDGSFDPATVTLVLDGIDRTAAATMRQAGTALAARALIRYKPAANLTVGPHPASFTYLTEGGPMTIAWTINVANIACPMTASLSVETEAGTSSPTQSAPDLTPTGEPITPGSSPMQSAFRRLMLQR